MPTSRPNIIQIVADDMGYGDFSRFNFGASRTPTLDQFIDEGVCLTQHYSAAPVCAPARASLLTGRYSHRTGAVDTLEGRGLDRLGLAERTMADALSQAGYATSIVGKWHNGALDERYHPDRRGFDEFVGFRGGWTDYWTWQLERDHTPVPPDGSYLTDLLTDAAIDFVRRHRREPFYLQLAYNAPHYPFQAPAERVAPYLERGAFSRGVATLYAMLEIMDDGIARVLQTLHDLSLTERTIVMFTSDNGPHFGEHEGLSLTRYNCGFNGAKISVLEGGIRVPALIRWPDGLDGRRVLHHMMHFTDWLPTLLNAAGVPHDPAATGIDGRDMLGMLRGEPAEGYPARCWQFSRYEPVFGSNAAIREGDWKLVYPAIPAAMRHDPTDLTMDEELRYQPGRHTAILEAPLPHRELPEHPPAPALYNLAADPFELNDLAGEHPERVRNMSTALARWFDEVERDRLAV